jgi:NAD-dependent deacetylase
MMTDAVLLAVPGQRKRSAAMISPPDLETIERIVDLLGRVRSILFVTGAGMSADSGLPTYRGVGGLYEQDETEDGYAIEEMLSGEMFRARPELTWKYLRQIERTCQGAKFNRGHAVIAEMEQHFPRVWTLTQNVDGFHHDAGSRNVITIHGRLHQIRCTACSWCETVREYTHLADLPRCQHCSAVLRPDVVLFGEMLPEAGVREMKYQVREGFDLVFSIGTTSVFPYISYPVEVARERDKPTVEINLGTTRISAMVRYRLAMGAAAALDAIWKRYNEKRTKG